MPTGPELLRGHEVAITGRLASMGRDEAIRRIEEAGGRYVEMPGDDTVALVVGREGWPLRNDGQLTRSLQLAQEMQDRGHAIIVMSEEDFLVTLGLGELQGGLRRLYTIEQLGRILGVPDARIRAWVRDGLIQPSKVVRRLCWFDFRQVASLRALQQLQSAGVTTGQLRKSLEQLRRWLPDAQTPLTQLEALESGGGLLVRTAEGRLAEPGGQLHLDFGASQARSESPKVKPLRGAKRPVRVPDQADDWFRRGVAAEDKGNLEEAANSYMNALLAGGPQAETSFNLGNVLYGLGRHGEAMQRYLQALELDPDYVEAWNNLGNTLAQMGQKEQAAAAYRQALAIEPAYADAHCNLAEALEDLGRAGEARRHWVAYLDLDPDSPWAKRIRDRLDGQSEAPPRDSG
jgi:tetratricopeptide (TPR) repeat protein